MEINGRKWLPHEPPFFVKDHAVYFITICVRNREGRLLLEAPIPSRLLKAIRFYHDQRKWWIHVAVIMPDHIHLLASFANNMEETVRSWKRWTAKNVSVDWQDDFFDHRVRNDESLIEKADYILMNPVRGGLVSQWQEWPFVWIGE